MLTEITSLSINELLQVFNSGCKSDKNFKIGLESERLGVLKDCKAAPYLGNKGIQALLRQIQQESSWQPINEGEYLIGLRKDNDTITLEPGGQFELSLSPKSNIKDIETDLINFNQITSNLAKKLGIKWLGYGVQPVSSYNDIQVLPKSRYEFMSKYLPTVGEKSLVMMKESSGTQAAFDYKDEQDAINKLRTMIALSPIMSGVFANSPIRNGKDTGYKSYRAYSWLHTDNSRCGLIDEKLFDDSFEFGFNDYKERLLDIPMIFIVRDNYIIKVNGEINFRQYLNQGYQGIIPNYQDWELQMSLFFPDVRLKNFIEVRNIDCQSTELTLAMPAFCKGILYNEQARLEVMDILKVFKWDDLNELRSLTPKHGIDVNLNGIDIADIAKEIVNVSFQSLKSMDTQEEKYLLPLLNLLKDNKTPADIILEKWYGEWDKDVSKLVNYVTI